MNRETTFIIAYYKQHPELTETIHALLCKGDKTFHMKLHFDLEEDTELTQVQCDLFYAALSKIEWDIVINELEKME